ncbi:hypothetical protein GCM10022254_29200 [Actinomadura meridiana]|uniref:Uncharacterized protein n=1 Tax=Actinomadura meridiana TaxID=559626 RepID=A0ABP8C1K1_9ACTN
MALRKASGRFEKDGPAESEGRLPVAMVWTALAIETGTALVVAGALVGWARRRFAHEGGPAD